MANVRGKTVDTTHLSIDQAEKRGFIHRDYIAHCLRWSHVVKHIGQSGRYKTTRILDVGCGTDLPLAKTLYTSRMAVQQYVGIDYNRPDKFDTSVFHTGKMPVRAFGGVDFAEHITLEHDRYSIKGIPGNFDLPNVITCFEVLEHVEPEHARRMLELMHAFVEAGQAQGDPVTVFISTPCWDANVGAAANHVSEIKREALGAVIEDIGMKVQGNWGTFASQRDYKDELRKQYGDAGVAMFDRLNQFYDSNYTATIMAPLFPAHSRNNLWQLTYRAPGDDSRKFPALIDVPTPWTCSAEWRGLHVDAEALAEAEEKEMVAGCADLNMREDHDDAK